MLRQSQQQRLLQKLSPQQIQLMKMLQLPTMALEQRIKEELEANPALEEGEDQEEEITNEDDINEDVNEEEVAVDEDGEDTVVEKDEFLMEDYMDEDEGDSYKLKVNNTGPDDERK